MRILHRDVKPSNVLMRHDGYVALTDFGLCGELDGGGGDGEPTRRPLIGKTGTRGYWAPEVVRKEVQAEAADYWSLGVVLAYAATGAHPFHKRWVERGEALEPPPPECVYVRAPAEEQQERLLGAIEEALSSHKAVAAVAAAAEAARSQIGQKHGASEGAASEGAAGETPLVQRTPSTPATPATPASPSSELRGMPEEGMNYNTLFLPLRCAGIHRLQVPLRELLEQLLEREPNARMATPVGAHATGAGGTQSDTRGGTLSGERGGEQGKGAAAATSPLRSHPFFASIEWNLLAARRLPAPFLPSREIVYAKDFIAPLSQDEIVPKRRDAPAEPGWQAQEGKEVPGEASLPLDAAIEGWGFVCSSEVFKEELAECAAAANPGAMLKACPVAPCSPALQQELCA